jgi:hypothetical protein
MTEPTRGARKRYSFPQRARRVRVGRRRKFSMTAIMVNVFDVDIDVLVERRLLPVHRRDNSDSIAQAIQYVLGAAIPALAVGSLPMPRESRQRAGSRPLGARP